jgi:hypothetical protein
VCSSRRQSVDIQLNFINASNDVNRSSIVLFQKNVSADFDEMAVAWHVIQNCGQGDNHPFVFPMAMAVGASDSWGNYTPQKTTTIGQMWEMYNNQTGDVLQGAGSATSPTEVQVLNSLKTGAINASIYKGGKVLATKTSIAPQQKAVFQFKPTVWIGVTSEVVQGQVMNSAVISAVNTELSLLGLASANIVMTGGGAGPNSQPFSFTFDKVVMA